MSQKSYFLTTAILFTLIAIAHALRLAYGLVVTIGDVTVGPWPSWVGLGVGAILAWQGFRLARR